MSIGFGIQKNIKDNFSINTGDLIITNYSNSLFETGESIDLDNIDLSNLKNTTVKNLNKVAYNPVIYPRDSRVLKPLPGMGRIQNQNFLEKNVKDRNYT